MKKQILILSCLCAALLYTGCLPLAVKEVKKTVDSVINVTDKVIFNAVREILIQGIDQAGTALSVPGAYTDNPAFRIPVPRELAELRDKLSKLGLDDKVVELEVNINRAAEQAAAEALALFRDIVTTMQFTDAKAIIKGGATAATDYLKARAYERLLAAYTEAVHKALQQAKALKSLNDIMRKYNSIPLVRKKDISIEAHVAAKALDALFVEIGKAESAIRDNPDSISSDTVKTVLKMVR